MKYCGICETLVNTSKLLILSLLLVLCSFQLISFSYASVESESPEDIMADDDRVEGHYSAQTYISFPDDDAALIGDSVYGISPYILDVDYLQNFFD
jgi:hypothetical protein